MPSNTLFEYYKSRGQQLPGITERSKIFGDFGLGPASTYRGTFNQNVSLLERLKSEPEPRAGSIPAQNEPGSSGATPVSSLVPRVQANVTGSTSSSITPNLTPGATSSGQAPSIEDRVKNLETRYLEAIKGLPSKTDVLSKARTEAGLPEDIQRSEDLDQRLANLEASIFESEKDIRDRIKRSGGFVTESQTQRLVAREKQPLIELFNRLSLEKQRLDRSVSGKESRASALAGLQLEDQQRAVELLETEMGFAKDEAERIADEAKDLAKKEDRAYEDALDIKLKEALLQQRVSNLNKPSSQPKKLSPTQFNIRAGLAGLSEDQANDVITKDTPPQWFRTQEENKAQATLIPEELQKRWDAVRGKVQKESQTKNSEVDPFEAILQRALEGLPQTP